MLLLDIDYFLFAGFYLLGDSAYSCTKYLLTPYRDNGHLSHAETIFNITLSSCRVVIEHCFGILKQRFRQLYYCKLRGIKKICHFILACIVLHNLADENDLEEFENLPKTTIANNTNSIPQQDTCIGKALRKEITKEVYNNYIKNKKKH